MGRCRLLSIKEKWCKSTELKKFDSLPRYSLQTPAFFVNEEDINSSVLKGDGHDVPEKKRMKRDQTKPLQQTIVTEEPDNCETPIHDAQDFLTPKNLYYRRNHFPYPSYPSFSWPLIIEGKVKQKRSFSESQLRAMPSRSLVMVMECAGNKRTLFSPKPKGLPWGEGAISQGKWKGVSLRYLLKLTGIDSSVIEVIFQGADQLNGVCYERSLPLDKALHQDTLIAYEMNDDPIPFHQGYPYRVIVPDWYAMASVKWLTRIILTDQAFTGPFQTEDYLYIPKYKPHSKPIPVREKRVNTIIQEPRHLDILSMGTHTIRGIAWSGTGMITRVEVSVDEGNRWEEAEFISHDHHPYAWKYWKWDWEISRQGTHSIWIRATDSSGRIQPEKPEWNQRGYGYNGYANIQVTAVEHQT